MERLFDKYSKIIIALVMLLLAICINGNSYAKEAGAISINKGILELYAGTTEKLTASVTGTDRTVTWTSTNEKAATVDKNGNVKGVSAGATTITAKSNFYRTTATCSVLVYAAPTSIKYDISSTNLNIGDKLTLSMTITPQTNLYGKGYVSDESVLNATFCKNGKCKIEAKKAGKSTVTFRTTNGKEAKCEVTVLQPVTGLDLNIVNKTLNIGNSFKLNATVLPSNASNKKVIWKSIDQSIATVNDNGEVKAVKGGTTTIIATSAANSKVTKSCIVTVLEEIKPTSIKLNTYDETIYTGHNKTLIATITPSNATNKGVNWSSSDKNVATVQNGVVTPQNPGEATIKATAAGNSNVYTYCKITVKRTVTGLSISPSSKKLAVGGSAKLTANIFPQDAEKSVNWYSSDESVVTVNQKGEIKARKAGTATITVRSLSNLDYNVKYPGNKIGILSGTCKITVCEVYLGDTDLDGEITSADARQILRYATNLDKIGGATARQIADIDEDGKITPDDARLASRLSVKLETKKVMVKGIKASETAIKINPYKEKTIKLSVTPSSARPKIKWTSSDERIATVDSNGKIRGLKEGKTTVYAKVAGNTDIYAKINVEVFINVDTIVLKGNNGAKNGELKIGNKMTIKAEISPSNATDKSLTWTSSNDSLVSFDKNGVVTANKPGFVTITAMSNQNPNVTAKFDLKILGEDLDKTATEIHNYMSNNGYTYGGLNAGKTSAEMYNVREVNCISYVTWVYCKAGYLDVVYNQVTVFDEAISTQEKYKDMFVKIEDSSKLKPGDIIIFGAKDHAEIYHGKDSTDKIETFNAGNTDSIQGVAYKARGLDRKDKNGNAITFSHAWRPAVLN